MKEKHLPTYEHMLRVGRLCWPVAKFTGNDAPGLRLAGLCHDIGKLNMKVELLNKPCKEWTQEDGIAVQQHVTASYDTLMLISPFTAHIAVRHHWFQQNPYPQQLPALPISCSVFEEEIEILAKLLAIVDCYDAKWRGGLNGKQIKEEMPRDRPYYFGLQTQLYTAGIFTESAPF